MKVIVEYDDATYQTLDPSTFPRFAQVKNHVEMFSKNILDYTGVPLRFNGIPSVMQQIQTPYNRAISLPDNVQWWMYSLFEECAPDTFTEDDIKKCWRNTMMGAKAFTNKTAWDNGFRDVVLGENMGNPEGFKLQPTICHGATVKVLRPLFWKAQMWQAEIEVLDVLDPSIVNRTYKDNRWLIFPAINWYRFPLPYGRADPFPLLGEKDVPIPLLGIGTNKGYMDAAWLRFLAPGEVIPANPYWGK